jgi:ABC-type antimicrobial peptide transport system permease subunit
VGVVGDVNHDDLGGQRRPAMYLPQAQVTDSYLVLVVKAAPAPPQSLAESLRASIRQLDATVPVYGVASLSELLSKAVDQRRFVMRLLVIFAAIAVLLAAVGLYGVVSHGVEQRRRELGVRVALGATRADIGRLVLGGGAGVVLIGLGCGLLGAAAAVRVLGARVPGVDPADPVAFLGATAVLVTVAFAAHLIPLRRAVRLDPAIALRGQ